MNSDKLNGQRRPEQIEFFEDLDDGDTDPAEITPAEVAKAVLYTADWTVDTILSQISQNNIDLSPTFQRRDVWSLGKKSMFVESLLLGFPVPQIVLAEQKGQSRKFIVLDGKQRLLTLMQFVGKAQSSKFNSFRLKDLEIRTDLNSTSYADMSREDQSMDDLSLFSNSVIRSVVIRNWPNNRYLHAVFHRLNSTSVALSPQELRLALFPGDFVYYVYRAAEEIPGLYTLLNLKEPDPRMRDVEVLLRYLGFALYIENYAGVLRDFLDDTCSKLNARWPEMESTVRDHTERFRGALSCIEDIFGSEHMARKWAGDGYERRPNKAVLDAMVYYFADPGIRTKAVAKAREVETAFQSLCSRDSEFVRSIETTTKSVEMTSTRLRRWGKTLEKVLGVDIDIPRLDKTTKRIIAPRA